MNLLRFGNRVSPRGDLDSAGAYFSSPGSGTVSDGHVRYPKGQQTFHEGCFEEGRPYDLVLVFGHPIAFAASEDGLEG